MARPLFSTSIDQLEAMASDPALPSSQLEAILTELSHRTRPRAKALQDLVAKLLVARGDGERLQSHAPPAPLLGWAGGDRQAPALSSTGDEIAGQKALSQGLAFMPWSTRARTFFDREGLTQLGELARFSERDVLHSPAMGRKTFSEMRQALSDAGLSFGMALGGWTPAAVPTRPQRTAETLDEPPTLNACLVERVRTVAKTQRNADWTLRRLGWGGGEPLTLEEIGTVDGVTRERVRQVVARAQVALKERFAAPPVLERALAMAAQQAPCTEAQMCSAFQDAGIDDGRMGFAALLTAAQSYDLPCDLVRIAVGDVVLIAPRGFDGALDRALRFARRQVSARGCVHVAQLAEQASQDRGGGAASALLARVLRASRDWAPLDAGAGWWWRPEQALGLRNRLANTIRKVMAVAPRLALQDLRDAIRRPHRTGHFAPPTPILAAMCEAIGMVVGDGWVTRRPSADAHSPLSPTEEMMVRVLLDQGPLAHREAFIDAATDAGVSMAFLNVAMTYSPLLWKPKLGYFALVGASLPPGVLEDLPAAALRTRREPAKDLWLADGRLLLAYRLRPGHLRSGILTIPLGHRGHVAGRYSLHPAGSETKRTIQLTDSGAGWNFSSSFRGLGAEEGDVALLLIDTEARLLKLWVGGRELQAAWDAGRAEEVVRALEAAAPEADSDEPETADDD